MNKLGTKGAFAFATVLMETNITNLECTAAPEYSLSCQRPLIRACSLTAPLARSLYNNLIEDKGATALAAILSKTKITHLKYTPPPQRVRFPVSAR